MICCCRPGIAGIVIGSARGWPGSSLRRPEAGASAAACARPALAAAARRDTSSTLRPMARMAARSGRTSATRAPAAVRGAASRPGLAMKPMPAATGATMTTRSYPCARSAWVRDGAHAAVHETAFPNGDRRPESGHCAAGAHRIYQAGVPGGIKHRELAGPRVHRGHLEGAGGPDAASSRASKTFRRSASGMVDTASAHLPIRARARLGSRLVYTSHGGLPDEVPADPGGGLRRPRRRGAGPGTAPRGPARRLCPCRPTSPPMSR